MLRVEDLCSLLPRRTLSRIMAWEGPVLRRIADNGPGRSLIRNVTHGGLGRLSVRLARSAGLLKGREPVEICMAVLRYFFEPFLIEEHRTDRGASFFLRPCPYGWRAPEDAALCDAVMQFERELVAGIGGSLVIQETIPNGFPRCRFAIRFGKAADPGDGSLLRGGNLGGSKVGG